jgi:hypothetical protein
LQIIFQLFFKMIITCPARWHIYPAPSSFYDTARGMKWRDAGKARNISLFAVPGIRQKSSVKNGR